MPTRIFGIYQRKRIVNVNVNIVAAGLLAILILKFPIEHFGRWIGVEHKFIITVTAVVLDITLDVALYYGLHWIANHWRPNTPQTDAEREEHESRKRAFMKDATIIQLERVILSPVYYLVAGGLMYTLQHAHVRPGWAFAISFLSGIIVTRVIHTIWGVRSGRFD